MSVRFTLSFGGEDQVDRILERFEQRSEDARPAFDAIATQLAEFGRRQFDTEGQAGSGQRWQDLSPSYAARKRKVAPGAPILVLTGRLRASLTERPLGVERIGRDYAELGSVVPYGAAHQQGAGNLPQRRPMDLPESVRRDMVRTLQRWLVEGDV